MMRHAETIAAADPDPREGTQPSLKRGFEDDQGYHGDQGETKDLASHAMPPTATARCAASSAKSPLKVRKVFQSVYS